LLLNVVWYKRKMLLGVGCHVLNAQNNYHKNCLPALKEQNRTKSYFLKVKMLVKSCININSISIVRLITLDIPVNAAYKHRRAQESDRPTHNPETKAKHSCVTEVKTSLEKSSHLGFEREVVE